MTSNAPRERGTHQGSNDSPRTTGVSHATPAREACAKKGILRGMRLRSGTSGFSYAEWKGTFYPEKARSKDFLRLFSAQIDCVEINNTFYRMPKPALFEDWTQQVPEGFSFV